MQREKRIGRPTWIAVPLALASLTGLACEPVDRPLGDPAAIAAWEASRRDSGAAPTESSVSPLKPADTGGGSGEQMSPVVGGVQPGTTVNDQASGAGSCNGDAGSCPPVGDAGVAPACAPTGPRDCSSDLDNDCDGQPDNVVDDVCVCALGTPEPCDEHPGLDGKGPCLAGLRTCVLGADGLTTEWGACKGAVGPGGPDSCTVRGDDADCDGTPNSDCLCVDGETQQCGSTTDTGPCAIGTSTCVNARFGECIGAVPPAAQDSCAPGDDSNCNGQANDRFCGCLNGATQQCGVTGTGVCDLGMQTCVNGSFGQCVGATNPGSRDCRSQQDNDCNGSPDNTRDNVCRCTIGDSQACQTHPGLDGIGRCRAGSQTCTGRNNNSSSDFNACTGSQGPMARNCDSPQDNDCDGRPDNTIDNICIAPLGLGEACAENGACATGSCEAFYVDQDRDGFSPSRTGVVRLCSNASFAPVGKTRREPTDRASTDCLDSNLNVNPGQVNFTAQAIPGLSGPQAYDYNCDGVSEYIYEADTRNSVSPANAVTCGFAPFDVCNGGKIWRRASGPDTAGPPDSTSCGTSSFVETCGAVDPQPSFPNLGCRSISIEPAIVTCL